MGKSRYVIIGGFLGAGKTSAMIRLAQRIESQVRSVGLITNDQSVDLVDTARVHDAGFPVREVTGSCFCCNFDGLMKMTRALENENALDVIAVEPVGSCTDIKATVAYPLRALHGETYEVAPLSVVVDPTRLGQMLGIIASTSFSDKVVYIYRKQVEEADFIVLNKIDLLEPNLRKKLVEETRAQFPRAQIFEVSCHTGEGMSVWFDAILNGALGNEAPMEVNYDIYAEGEALMGWLNTSFGFSSVQPLDGNALLFDIATNIRDRLKNLQIEIAHLKMALETHDADFGALSVSRTNAEPQITETLVGPCKDGTVVINLRAEADPEILKKEVEHALGNNAYPLTFSEEIRAFRPGRPTPTHRMVSSS